MKTKQNSKIKINQTNQSNSVSCFVCDKQIVLNSKNVFTQVSRYTGTSVCNILDKFIGENMQQKHYDHIILCRSCLAKIDEYDLAMVTAERVESELKKTFYETISVSQKNTLTVESNLKNEKDKCKVKIETDKKECDDIDNTGGDTINQVPTMLLRFNEFLDNFNEPFEEEEQQVKNESEDNKIPQQKNRTALSRKIKIPTETLENKSTSSSNLLSVYEEGYLCDKCTNKFNTKSELRQHLKTHEPIKKHTCEICGQTCKSKASLLLHVDVHKGKSPHECDMCGKRFTQKGALARHMPMHTGEHPYQCDKCGKQFIHYSSFHMHQLAHDNIRDKKCSECGLLLRSSSHLTRHMRVHSGEKPYSCPSCGQKFAQRYNMMTHYKTHQGIHRATPKTHTCQICRATFPKITKLNEHMSSEHNLVKLEKQDQHQPQQQHQQQQIKPNQLIPSSNQSIISQQPNLIKEPQQIIVTQENGNPSEFTVTSSSFISNLPKSVSSNMHGSATLNTHLNSKDIKPNICSVQLPSTTINIPISNFLVQNSDLLQIKKEHYLENV